MPGNAGEGPPTSGEAIERSWDAWGVGPVHGAATEGRGWWQGEPLTAADVMTANVSSVPRQMPVTQLAELMRRESVGLVPVVDADESLVGIVTDRDIVVRGCVSVRPLAEQRAGDLMTAEVICARADETLVEVVDRMARRGVRRLPVLEAQRRRDGKVLGIVSLDDIESHRSEDPALIEALHRLAVSRRGEDNPAAERGAFFPSLWRRLRAGVGAHP
jgi:CBS domain-containing protein